MVIKRFKRAKAWVAYNIDWDIDMTEAFERLDELTPHKAGGILGISAATYGAMTTEERHDYAYSLFHHCPGALCDLFELPDTVKIPGDFCIEDEDDDEWDAVTDWLSDTYGFCINNYQVRKTQNKRGNK